MELKKPRTEGDAAPEMDPNLVQSMSKLQEVQDLLDKTNEEANDKVLEIEQAYMEKRRPIYKTRNQAIEKIPEFWLTAFMSHPHLSDLLNEDDVKAFKFLKGLNVEELGDIKTGYKITFEFEPNPYFEDEKLCKIFKYAEDAPISDKGNAPRWKEGMDLTKQKKVEKKGKKRPLISSESFFNWFDESIEEEMVVGMMNDEIGEIIKDDLWVNPLRYFNNSTDSEEDDDDNEDDDDDDNKDDEDEDSSDEEDDDDDDGDE